MKTAFALTLAIALAGRSILPAFAQETASIREAEEHRTVDPGFPISGADRFNPEPLDVCRVNEAEFYPYDCIGGTRGTGSTASRESDTGAAGE